VLRKRRFPKQVASLANWGCGLLLVMLTSACALFESQPQIEEFGPIGVPLQASHRKTCLANVDGDVDMELVYVSAEMRRLGFIDVWESPEAPVPFMRPLGEVRLDPNWVYFKPRRGDLNGDGIDEILVACRRDSLFVVHGYRLGSASPVVETEPLVLSDGDGDGSFDTSGQAIVIPNSGPSGGRAILATASSGYDLVPRSACLFDVSSGEKLWEFPVPGVPSPPELCILHDANRDGRLDALVSSTPVCNGRHVHGKSDSLGHVFCIDGATGSMLWSHTFGRGYGIILHWLHDLDADDEPELVVAHHIASNGSRMAFLGVLNPDCGTLIAADTIASMRGWISRYALQTDDGSSRLPFLIGGRDRHVYEYSLASGRLERRRFANAIPFGANQLHYGQMWGNPEPELLWSSRRQRLATDLRSRRLLASAPISTFDQHQEILGHTHHAGRLHLIAAHEPDGMLSQVEVWALPKLRYRLSPQRVVPLAAALCMGLGLGGVLGSGHGAIRRALRRRPEAESCLPLLCLRQALQSRREKLNTKGVDVVEFRVGGAGDGVVGMDHNELRWILEELLDNAVTAMERTHLRQLRFRVARDGADLALSIEDSGPGVPEELRDAIFDKGISTQNAGEHGYGLYRAREMLRCAQGELTLASSSQLGGAHFICRLPMVCSRNRA